MKVRTHTNDEPVEMFPSNVSVSENLFANVSAPSAVWSVVKAHGIDPQSTFRKLQRPNKLSASAESLVVNSNEAKVGAHIGTNATSVTVITSNGVVSYQQGGSIPIGRAAGWAVNFDRLLRDKVGFATFSEFLKKEFSEENIIFWKKCEDYKKNNDQEKRKILAANIFKLHVSANASQAVNIDSQCLSNLTEAIERAAPELFETAKKQIFQLMKQDSYPRFLKSDLYKTSVKLEIDGLPLPFSEHANGRVTQPDAISTGSRESIGKKSKFLKKSQSGNSVEEGGEKRRRSLLPWGKKDKAKVGKVASEVDLEKHGRERVNNTYGKKTVDVNELKQLAQDDIELRSKDDTCSVDEQNQKFLRVALPDGSTTVIYAKQSTTVRAAIAKLCERRNLDVHLVDVYSSDKVVDQSRDVSKLGTKEISLEPRIVFRVDLPNKKSLAIKAPGHRPVKKALSPVLRRYGLKLDAHVLHEVGSSSVLSADLRVSDIEHKRIGVFTADDFTEWGGFGPHRNKPILTKQHTEPSRLGSSLLKDEDKQFDDLFNGDIQLHAKFDSDGVLDFTKKDEKTSKEENRMSGLFSNLLRKNSMDGKDGGKVKGKRGVSKATSKNERVLPARTRSHNEDFKVFALLSKVSTQFDDQRGPLRKQDLELPDFLKPKNTNSVRSDDHAMEYPLRKTEMHSSDTSLYEPNTEVKGKLERMRTLSNSEERLDNLLMKQFRGSSRNKSGYSIHSSYAQPTDVTPSKFPFMDASFSSDGVFPTHGAAENLFATPESQSPDFNRSGLMEKSRVDFGTVHLSEHHTSHEGQGNRPSVYRELIPPTLDSKSSQSSAHKNRDALYAHQNKDAQLPVPAPRKKCGAKRSKQSAVFDTDSVCSDVSNATQSSSGLNSTNSSDLDNTLMPPSDESDLQSISGAQVKALPTTPRGVLNLDPNRQKFFPATAGRVKGTITSPLLQRPLKEQSISWAMGRQTHIPQSPLPHASYRAPSRGSTPSPTTHDLVLLPESSPDDASEEFKAPTPTRRTSLNRKGNSSLEEVVERGAAAQQKVHKLRQRQSSEDESVQVSYV